MSVLEVASDSDAGDGSTVQLKPGVTPSGRQSRAKGATPRELADAFAKIFGLGSLGIALWVDDERAALENEEANAIAEPFARIWKRQKFLARYSNAIINSDDYLALSMALFSYGMRISPYVAAKMGSIRPNAKPINSQPAPTPVRAQSDGASNGNNGHYDPANGVKFDPGSMADAYGTY